MKNYGHMSTMQVEGLFALMTFAKLGVISGDMAIHTLHRAYPGASKDLVDEVTNAILIATGKRARPPHERAHITARVERLPTGFAGIILHMKGALKPELMPKVKETLERMTKRFVGAPYDDLFEARVHVEVELINAWLKQVNG